MEKLTFNEYQVKTRRTVQKYLTLEERRLQDIVCLIGETSEVVEIILESKDIINENKDHIKEEIGDVIWYMSRLLDDYDIEMYKVAHSHEMDAYSYTINGLFGTFITYQTLGIEKFMNIESRKLVHYAGKSVEVMKKHIFHKHELDIVEMERNVSHLLKHLTFVSMVLGFTIGDVAKTNLIKTNKRYPNGFEKERSIERSNEK